MFIEYDVYQWTQMLYSLMSNAVFSALASQTQLARHYNFLVHKGKVSGYWNVD